MKKEVKAVSALLLSNGDGTIRAEVVPAHGGMIAQIWLKGKELLHLDRGVLETAPMAAGGMPILFPFSSKTRDDSYVLDGKTYYMPMHGLVKNDGFAVKCAEADRVTLWVENSPSWKAGYYPFDFHLEVEYQLQGSALTVTFRITNKSQKAMPHSLGWHPFFKSTDKQRIRLEQDMQIHYDYKEHVDGSMCQLEDLSRFWDDVFHTPVKGGFLLENQADGYKIQCEPDEVFDAMVVCSWVQESMCVEPWCGLPDSINTGRLLKWIQPGETMECRVRLFIEECQSL